MLSGLCLFFFCFIDVVVVALNVISEFCFSRFFFWFVVVLIIKLSLKKHAQLKRFCAVVYLKINVILLFDP